jgi:hypothetical protein
MPPATPFADGLITRISAAGLGTYGTNIFIGARAKVPLGPGPFITLVEEPGFDEEIVHNGPGYLQPAGRFIVRAGDYDAAMIRAWAIYTVLRPVKNMFIGTTWWRELHIRGVPFDLQPDEVQRPRIALKLDAVIRPAAPTPPTP